jgi:subtilisin family serine protease
MTYPRRLLAAAMAMTTALALAPAAAGASTPDPAEPGASDADAGEDADGADGAGETAGADDARDAAEVPAGSGRLLVSVADRTDVDDVATALAEVGEVDTLADRVLAVAADRAEVEAAVAPWEAAVEENVAFQAASRPDDPDFGLQWGLENTGQFVPEPLGVEGVPGIDVDALGAWSHTRGSRSTTIAVVDTVVEADHPDLAPNLRSGRSFAPAASPCVSSFASHGTEVAGVAAAVGNNGIGVSGMAPRARLLPVDFLDPCGEGDLEGAVAAISWAARNGADVIVASFASDPAFPPTDREVAALRTAIEDAGVPVIVAAGNNGRDLSASGAPRIYPASYNLRNQLTVAAVNNRGGLPSFSNRGRRHVDLAAPGQHVYTTSVSLSGEHRYEYGSGTSYAVPFVAGAVALALGLEPVLTPEAVLDLTVDTATPLDSLRGNVASGGMLDAGALVEAVAEGGACPTARVPAGAFRDVPGDSVHALGVDCIAWWEITRGRGDGTYEPRSPVTRGQMATFLATVVDEGPGLPSSSPAAFPDIAGSVHEGPIRALADLGIVRGFGDGTYRPSQPVTRAQMASFLVNTYEHLVGEAPSPSSRWFADTRGSVHEDAADSLWELGITAGTSPRTYDPHPDVRRDQMASFVARLLDRVAREGVVAPR